MSKKESSSFSLEIAGKKLTIELGKLAQQAHGSCTVRYGDTVVLATAVTGAEPREGIDYFPLMVDYEEKMYAAGKIKGSRWIKREGRPSDEAILTARLIDRAIRPLFKESERKDVQVMITVFSVDGENDPDFPALIAASTALAISPIPWTGPIGSVRIGQINGEWVLNGSYDAREKSDFDLFLTGTGEEVIMIEASGKEVSEKTIEEAVAFGLKHLKKVVGLIADVQKEFGVEKKQETPEISEEGQLTAEKLEAKVYHLIKGKIAQVFNNSKEEYKNNILKLQEEVDATLKEDNEVSKEARARGIALINKYLEEEARKLVLEKNIRVDGRQPDDIRELSCEVGLIPRVHGSGLFNRGETQVLSIVTLGSPGDEQFLDGMEEEGKKRYMHHYNFPPFSVGEVKPNRGPSRRDIGHGALAEKAVEPVLPDKEKFPYTIRVVSEVLSSNGSSSQAAACGTILALMDAGVPIRTPVAGIAMGLLTDPNNKTNYKILTDIQGIEDHAGDMDFKIAGTAKGITAIQLDIKLSGLSLQIVKETLEKAKTARGKILKTMAQTISEPRSELSPYAPRIITLEINPEKIREVIGPGGKIINKIIEECDVAIDIEPTGLVFITSTNEQGATKAVDWIKQLTHEVQIGEEYEGTVTQIIKSKDNGGEIGAIVEFLPGQDGMVHVSQIAWEHVNKVSDVLKTGDKVKVKVTNIDKEKDRIELSRKELLPKPKDFSDDYYNKRKDHKPRTKGHSRPFHRNR
ncbi:polyribonucleotide nucleotidyltransferase [Patescibacteria group bacterium]|nr:polyribonucleotide nucleotidyltransferase [Patescibacteria group bacterium]